MAESRVNFTIRGVDDTHERENIKDTLNQLDGVMNADIDDDGEASVRYDEDILGGEQVEHRVRKMGYETE
jgi:copper chaperone CopZ